jgi:peptidoglycan/xylan/chitin deacetylase (PgdA/CDA1 family)
VAALTFDDGPHPEFTPRLLDVLEKRHARATFFMVGKAAQRHPEIVRRVAAAGHAIGNHSWDHPSLPLLPGGERRAQVRAAGRALAPFGLRLFRPPYGHLSIPSRLDLLWLRYEVISWSENGHGEDWLDHDAGQIVDRLMDQVGPGRIIVLHDALYHAMAERYADRTPVIEAVERVLDRLGESFAFLTVPQLLREGPVQRRRWFPKVSVEFLNSLVPTIGEPRRYPAGAPRRMGARVES